MKKIILPLLFLIPFITFAQEKEKQKQLYRKPFTFTVGLNTQIFRQDYRYTTTESVVGSTVTTVRYNKIEGFKKPLYGIAIGIAKPIINDKLSVGIQTGISRIRDENRKYNTDYLYTIPLSILFKFYVIKNNNYKIKPFIKIKGGYNYMSYSSDFLSKNSLQGGLNYGFETGFSVYSKHRKWLNRLDFTVGYNYFFTKFSYEHDFPRDLKYSYNQRREGLTFGINYNFEQKKKRKHKKHKKRH